MKSSEHWQTSCDSKSQTRLPSSDARKTCQLVPCAKSEKNTNCPCSTHQNLTVEGRTDFDKVAKGAYVVYEM